MSVNRRLSDQFQLRLPDGMRERLKEAAAGNDRSMNAEIVARLEASFSGLFESVDAQNSRLGYRLERIERDLSRMLATVTREIDLQKAVRADPERLTPSRRAFRDGIRAFYASESKEYANPFELGDERRQDFLQGFFAAARRFYADDEAPQVRHLSDLIQEERAARRRAIRVSE